MPCWNLDSWAWIAANPRFTVFEYRSRLRTVAVGWKEALGAKSEDIMATSVAISVSTRNWQKRNVRCDWRHRHPQRFFSFLFYILFDDAIRRNKFGRKEIKIYLCKCDVRIYGPAGTVCVGKIQKSRRMWISSRTFRTDVFFC